jgi:hypothetical protein
MVAYSVTINPSFVLHCCAVYFHATYLSPCNCCSYINLCSFNESLEVRIVQTHVYTIAPDSPSHNRKSLRTFDIRQKLRNFVLRSCILHVHTFALFYFYIGRVIVKKLRVLRFRLSKAIVLVYRYPVYFLMHKNEVQLSD